MPAFIAGIYLLLALRVRISLEGSLCGGMGSLVLSAGAAGVYIRFDGIIRQEDSRIFLALVPRYAARSKKKRTKKAHGKSIRIIRRYLWFAKTGRMERLSLQARIGLGDAAGTAVAAGALRALASAVFERAGHGAQTDVYVSPDFERAVFAVRVRCLFSCQPGDMMLAAVRYAMRKKIAGKRD